MPQCGRPKTLPFQVLPLLEEVRPSQAGRRRLWDGLGKRFGVEISHEASARFSGVRVPVFGTPLRSWVIINGNIFALVESWIPYSQAPSSNTNPWNHIFFLEEKLRGANSSSRSGLVIFFFLALKAPRYKGHVTPRGWRSAIALMAFFLFSLSLFFFFFLFFAFAPSFQRNRASAGRRECERAFFPEISLPSPGDAPPSAPLSSQRNAAKSFHSEQVGAPPSNRRRAERFLRSRSFCHMGLFHGPGPPPFTGHPEFRGGDLRRGTNLPKTGPVIPEPCRAKAQDSGLAFPLFVGGNFWPSFPSVPLG